MPSETRATKRIKLSPSETKCSPLKETAAKIYTARLNALSTTAFAEKYIPSSFLVFQPLKVPDATYQLDYYSAAALPKQDYDSCYDLLELTSKEDYVLSTRGWHPDHKRVEMLEDPMRYFVVRRVESRPADSAHNENNANGAVYTPSEEEQSDVPLDDAISSQASQDLSTEDDEPYIPEEYAFLSYQLSDDWTNDAHHRIPVLYIYEIHLTANLRSIGLGKHLMDLAAHIASATRMKKLELSVFTRNVRAERFYRGLGYDTDETGPQPAKLRGRTVKPDWLVLSRPVEAILETEDGHEESSRRVIGDIGKKTTLGFTR
jgi:N-alpha-acetyltransferase 40